MVGGAVLHAVWAAHQLNRMVGVLTKTAAADKSMLKEFPQSNTDIHWLPSKETTSIKNDYTTTDKETRICTNLGQADPYEADDFPDFKAKAIQYSGLITGEIDLELIKSLGGKSKLAVDAQGLTRKVHPDGSMRFSKWEEMREALPHIHYFKADAAEAEFLTEIPTQDTDGRIRAGKKFVEMGAKEVIISHNKELIAITRDEVHQFPFKNRNLSGRTGRGDTSFATYITERFDKSPKNALLFATALTSLKMEIPGPFKKTREDVQRFIEDLFQ